MSNIYNWKEKVQKNTQLSFCWIMFKFIRESWSRLQIQIQISCYPLPSTLCGGLCRTACDALYN